MAVVFIVIFHPGGANAGCAVKGRGREQFPGEGGLWPGLRGPGRAERRGEELLRVRSANAAFSGVGGVGLPWRVRRAKELGGGARNGDIREESAI